MENVSVEKLMVIQPQGMQRLTKSFEKNRIAHAYIFEGGKGTGKIALMRYFVQLLLCDNPQNNVPCETCRACKLVKSGNHLNVVEIHPDGQDIKKDQILNLIYEMNKTGLESGRKIYVLHQAERLNTAAANTLLKFLEEPEGNVTAILLTERYQSILSTIQSRCQHISLRALPREELIRQLIGEGVTESMASTATMITRNSEEALNLTNDDQFALARKTVLKLVEVSERNVHEALLFIQEEWLSVFKEKEEVELGLDLLLFAYRDIMAIKSGLIASITYPDQVILWKQLALHITYESLANRLEAILQAKQHLQRNMNKTLLMEQLMLHLQEGNTFV